MDNKAKTVTPTGMLIDTKDIEAAGEALGVMYAALMKGFKKGVDAMQDIYKEQRSEEDTADSEDQYKTTDCINCWCNECEEIDQCEDKLNNNIRPMPCVGCNHGMRFMPKEKPPCIGFKTIRRADK